MFEKPTNANVAIGGDGLLQGRHGEVRRVWPDGPGHIQVAKLSRTVVKHDDIKTCSICQVHLPPCLP